MREVLQVFPAQGPTPTHDITHCVQHRFVTDQPRLMNLAVVLLPPQLAHNRTHGPSGHGLAEHRRVEDRQMVRLAVVEEFVKLLCWHIRETFAQLSRYVVS